MARCRSPTFTEYTQALKSPSTNAPNTSKWQDTTLAVVLGSGTASVNSIAATCSAAIHRVEIYGWPSGDYFDQAGPAN